MATFLCCAAIAGPALLPIGTPPLMSFDTEATALLAWGLWLAWLSPHLLQPLVFWPIRRNPALLAGLAMLGIPLACAAASVGGMGLPPAIGMRHGVVLLAAGMAVLTGARLAGVASEPAGGVLTRTVLMALLVTGLLSAAIAVLQYLGIQGPWEPLGKDGRAGANLGQPNLLGTQLLWAMVSLVALAPQRNRAHWPVLAGAALLVTALALSSSRSAALASVVLAGWGVLDRQLERRSRWLLIAMPAAVVLAWAALAIWQQHGGPGFAGTGLLQKADPSSSRWRVWQQCVRLVSAQPWFGVGWGQFNFAWTLTPMPGLPRTAGYTFGHAHNIVLQWAVEMGVPLTVCMVGLVACVVLHGVRHLWRSGEPAPISRRAALAMVLVVLVHSQFEYPLWQANFLLPTAFLMGMTTAGKPDTGSARGASTHSAVGPLLLSLAAAFALLDYRAIAAVWSPPNDAPPLAQRIAQARKSVLFGHFADRFDATLAPSGHRRLDAYNGIAFELIDLRLLASWSLAQSEGGHPDKARFLAARLREFDSPAARIFFAGCALDPQLVQCSSSDPALGYRDFR